MKQLRPIAVLALFSFAAACGNGGGTPPVTVTAVTVTGPTPANVPICQTIQLTGIANGSDGSAQARTLSWTSGDGTIATVSQSGVVRGVGPGTTQISASTDGKTGSLTVTVTQAPVATITFNVASPLAIAKTGVISITATTKDAGGATLTGRTITWTTSDASKVSLSPTTGATVSATGVEVGSSTITATSEGISAQITANVTIQTPITVTGVSPAILQEGSAATITGTNFSSTASSNAVTIDGVVAAVTGASATQLTITVPDLGCRPAARRTVLVNVGGQSASQANVPVAPALTPVALSVGQVKVVGGPAAVGCIQFPASVSTRDYVVIATNASGIDDGAQATPPIADRYTLISNTGDATPLGGFGYDRIVASRAGSLAAPRLSSQPGRATLQDAQDHRFREQARALPLRAARAAVMASGANRRMNVAGAPRGPRLDYAVGDVKMFRVPKATGNACTSYDSLTAVVKAVGTKGVIFQDVAAPSSGFVDADFTAISNEFDSQIYPADVAHFGVPTDINIDGKIIILYTPRVNDFTPPNSGSFVGGFFFAGDLFPRTGSNVCLQSNEAELVYLLTPDPNKEHGNTFTTAFVKQLTRGTVAHEFQHMINAGGRIFNPLASAFEATWLDEALAHIGEETVGRAERAFGDLQPLTTADVQANNNDFNAFFFQNLARFRLWLQAPDTSNANSERAGPFLAYRGAAWSFLRYVTDQYSNNDVPTFLQAVVAGPDTSLANLLGHAGNGGPPVPYDSALVGWAVANYTSGLGVAGLTAKYAYKSWNMRDAESGITSGVYPLQVLAANTLSAGLRVRYRSGSAQYFRFDGTGGAMSSANFRMLANDAASPATATGRLYIIRIQ
ncbi:MAG: IPT/TIG domain-containing protein [Gemmatimonadaceae bacterium]